MPAKKAAKTNKVMASQKPKASASSVILRKQSTPTKPTGLTVKTYDVAGKSVGTITLPKEIFGQKPNKVLLSQAIRVYETNANSHKANTKTRAEVRGGGRKPWKQKGTGNARAGSRRSPLWVGGGITFGPRTRDVKLDLPHKMRKSALISALSARAQEGSLKVITNIEKIEPKTKIVANLIQKLEVKTPVLFVYSENPQKAVNVKLASRNIQKVTTNEARNLNAFEVLKNREIIFSTEAITLISKPKKEKTA